jgi:hypothetical protein
VPLQEKVEREGILRFQWSQNKSRGVYVDFDDSAVLEFFGFAQYVLDGDGVFVSFGVDDVFPLGFSVEDNVEFAHS